MENGAPIGKPFRFGIVGVVPEAVAIVVLAAPVGAADVVVQNDHDAGFGESGDDRIHDLHGVFAAKL